MEQKRPFPDEPGPEKFEEIDAEELLPEDELEVERILQAGGVSVEEARRIVRAQRRAKRIQEENRE